MSKINTAWRTQQENARRSRVDELIQRVVAQINVAMTSNARQPVPTKLANVADSALLALVKNRG